MTLCTTAADFHRRAVDRYRRGDLVGALADFEAATDRDPSSGALHNMCGVIRRALGDRTGAFSAFEEAIRRQPDFAEAFNNRGVVYLNEGNFMAALADFDAALRIMPDYIDALTNRGVARRSRGDLASAKADFDRVLEARPSDLTAIRNRSTIRRELRDLSGALADLDVGIAVVPRSASAVLYLDRGVVRLLQADWLGAIADFDQAIKINPWYTEAYVYRANAHFHNCDTLAMQDYLRAFAIDDLRAAREIVEVIGGDLIIDRQKFFDDCQKHLASDPDDLAAITRRGLGMFLLGRLPEAATDLDRLKELGRQHASHVQMLRMSAATYQKRWREGQQTNRRLP